MKLLHQIVTALFFIYHAYATTTNTEPCEKKDDSGDADHGGDACKDLTINWNHYNMSAMFLFK